MRSVGQRGPTEYIATSQTAPHTSVSTSGSTSSASSTTDRKRRHAGSSPERRGYPYPVGYQQPITGRRPSGMSAATAGGSREAPIDLTTSPPFPQRPHIPQHRRSSERMRAARVGGPTFGANGHPRNTYGLPVSAGGTASGRRDSDFTPPRWQPDGEVSKCPVCQTDFHFFYRKHHCRKCGRVVCAACSPHRITIPRQYIVQPPNGDDGEEFGPGAAMFGVRNLGGGENVRVCNPCVPDPWTPETAAAGNSGGVEGQQRGQEPARRRTSEFGTSHQPDRYRNILPPIPRRDDSNARARAYTHQQASTHSRSMPRQSYTPDPANANRVPIYQPPGPPVHPSTFRHRHSQSQSAVGVASSSTPPIPPRPVQRREVREEDECPVCGTELPPNNAVREAHIQECISARFSTSAPQSQPPPTTGPFPPPTAPAPSSSTPPQGDGVDMSARPRATSYRPRGMAIYRATEKDCLDENGEAQECIICFEDFQPGEELGRLECWCKFHRLCIRRWWERSTPGGCPTHVLHE